MKRLVLIFTLIFLLVSVYPVHAEELEIGCPGRTEATMGVDYILNPLPLTGCVRLEVVPDCAPGSPHALTISNENCEDILVYVSGDGEEHELVSKENPESRWNVVGGLPYSFVDEEIPQDIGAEWMREFYFENNPEEKVIIDAKNLPIREYYELIYKRYNVTEDTTDEKDYTLYYILGAIILIVVIAFLISKYKVWQKSI
ncbi:MAG: hypothetical protein JSV39_02520 [Candidatus Aenigmatarchaeota archaeon]|nr:MAG: hypothetical protein JSV39_02520 [Candidatus Aenigmarchaeota archaeon]